MVLALPFPHAGDIGLIIVLKGISPWQSRERRASPSPYAENTGKGV